MDYNPTQVTIKETPYFKQKYKKSITQECLEKLYDYLEIHPDAGDLISGTGGVRKIRWQSGKNNKGKIGGVRVLYYYVKDLLIILITIYSKSEKEDISLAERNELKRTIPQLVALYKEGL